MWAPFDYYLAAELQPKARCGPKSIRASRERESFSHQTKRVTIVLEKSARTVDAGASIRMAAPWNRR
jgi:hypothetical protein